MIGWHALALEKCSTTTNKKKMERKEREKNSHNSSRKYIIIKTTRVNRAHLMCVNKNSPSCANVCLCVCVSVIYTTLFLSFSLSPYTVVTGR